MEHGDNRTGADTDGFRHGDGMDKRESQEAPPGIGHSIRPDMPVPDTVLVAVMNDGSYLLVGYPQREPAAFVIAEDAGSLRQALEAAFGNPTDEAVSGNGNSNGIVVAGNGALDTKTVQP